MSRPDYPRIVGDAPYRVLRHGLDVFVVTWIGESLFSRAIRRFAPGGSHTSLGLYLFGSVFLAESLARGFSLTRASERFSGYSGTILLHPLELDPDRTALVKRTALNLAGRTVRYGFRTLAALAWRAVRVNMRRSVCSQAVAYILAEAGVIPPQHEVLSPGRLRALLPSPWRLAPYTKDGE